MDISNRNKEAFERVKLSNNFFSPKATEMVKNITNAFRRNLVNVDWMDVSTKAKAFVKVVYWTFFLPGSEKVVRL